MTDIEKSEFSDLEQKVLPKIEVAINNRIPLIFFADDAAILRDRFQREDFELSLNKKELASLIQGTQMRTRVVLDENDNAVGVEVYKRSEEEGKRWVRFDPQAGISESEAEDYFWDKESGKYDRSLGLLRILGPERFAKLAIDCYTEAKNKGYKGVIGKEKATKGRGLMQVAAHTLLLGITDPEEAEIREHVVGVANGKINTVLLKSFVGVTVDPAKTDSSLLDNFGRADIHKTPDELKIIAGIDPKSFGELVKYLGGLPNDFGGTNAAE